jgi:hypothetical protein
MHQTGQDFVARAVESDFHPKIAMISTADVPDSEQPNPCHVTVNFSSSELPATEI